MEAARTDYLYEGMQKYCEGTQRYTKSEPRDVPYFRNARDSKLFGHTACQETSLTIAHLIEVG